MLINGSLLYIIFLLSIETFKFSNLKKSMKSFYNIIKFNYIISRIIYTRITACISIHYPLQIFSMLEKNFNKLIDLNLILYNSVDLDFFSNS